jgi:hypothetical protein
MSCGVGEHQLRLLSTSIAFSHLKSRFNETEKFLILNLAFLFSFVGVTKGSRGEI